MWKTIDNTYYEVNENGEVRNVKSLKLLSQRKDKYGYYRVSIRNFGGKQKTYMIHRLVAKYFVKNPYLFNVVNHKDGNTINNNFNNLEWVDAKINSNHATRILLSMEIKNDKPFGVHWDKKRNKWFAHYKLYGKTKFVGRFEDKKAAYKALYYDFLKQKKYAPWNENVYRVFSDNSKTFNDKSKLEARKDFINDYTKLIMVE